MADFDGRNTLVLCGASGAGKGTTVELFKTWFGDSLFFSISYTTRSPRSDEIDGHHYHFVDREKFINKILLKQFLEHAEVHGAFYGTPIQSLQQAASTSKLIILDIDVQGAAQLKDTLPRACFVFLDVPEPELKRRLEERKKDAPEVITKRLSKASSERDQFITTFGDHNVIRCVHRGGWSFPPEHIASAVLDRVFDAGVNSHGTWTVCPIHSGAAWTLGSPECVRY